MSADDRVPATARIAARLGRLRAALAGAAPEQLADLYAQAHALAADAAALPAPPGRDDLAGLDEALERHLRIGDVPLPPGAPDDLRQLLAGFADGWLVPATLQELSAALEAYAAGARDAYRRKAALDGEVAAAAAYHDALKRYLAVLDAIEPPPAGGEPPPPHCDPAGPPLREGVR
jgi:hypothetical protein